MSTGVSCRPGLTCGAGSRCGLELQQQSVSDPAVVLQRPQEGLEGPGPAGREEVQQPEGLQPVGGPGLDVLDLSVRQDVLLEQEGDDGVTDQQLGRQIQSVSPQQVFVNRVHVEDRDPWTKLVISSPTYPTSPRENLSPGWTVTSFVTVIVSDRKLLGGTKFC